MNISDAGSSGATKRMRNRFQLLCPHLRKAVKDGPAILSYFPSLPVCARHSVMYNMRSNCCDSLHCSRLLLSFVQLRLLRRRSTRAASKSETITVHRIVFTHILNDAPSHAVTALLRFFPRSELCSTTSSLVLSPSCRRRYILTLRPLVSSPPLAVLFFLMTREPVTKQRQKVKWKWIFLTRPTVPEMIK